MEIDEKQIKKLKKQPIIETSIKKSEDGLWIIHKTTIIDIKPISYLEKVLSNVKIR